MTTQTFYQLNHDYGSYSHSEVLILDKDYDLVKEAYNEAYQSTIDEEDSFTDSLSIESVEVTLDEDGEVDEIIDYIEVLDECVFKPYED
jgi:hypothetical protein